MNNNAVLLMIANLEAMCEETNTGVATEAINIDVKAMVRSFIEKALKALNAIKNKVIDLFTKIGKATGIIKYKQKMSVDAEAWAYIKSKGNVVDRARSEVTTVLNVLSNNIRGGNIHPDIDFYTGSLALVNEVETKHIEKIQSIIDAEKNGQKRRRIFIEGSEFYDLFDNQFKAKNDNLENAFKNTIADLEKTIKGLESKFIKGPFTRKSLKVYSNALAVTNACYAKTSMVLGSFIHSAKLACDAKLISEKEDK